MRLTPRRLNRATLARQLLLERGSMDVVGAVEQLGGLQAQEPASPYVALATRVADFEPNTLTAALRAHQVVKATLARSTLHIVSRADYRASLPAHIAVTCTRWMSEQRGLPVIRSLPELTAESLAYAVEPRTNVQLRDHAATLGEPVSADELWRRIRRYGAFVHVPGSEPWGFDRRPVQIAAQSWFEPPDIDEDASLAHIVRSHLRGFGPARLADTAQWAGLSVTRLRRGLARLDEELRIARYRDEDGRELLDLADALLPDENMPVPPRLLPMWDETLLAYADRSRVLPEAYRKRVIVKGGDVLPTFMVDGYVAGLWWVDVGANGRPRIDLEPFDTIGGADREGLESEAQRIAELIAEREPTLYARYRHTRRRD